MSNDYQDAVEGLRALRPQYRNPRIKVTGFLNADGTVSPDPTTNAKIGYVWVRGYPRGANVQVIAGPDINPHVPNVKVNVGENHANQAVAYGIVVDENAITQFGAGVGAVAANPIPAEQANQPVPYRSVTGGRVLPRSDTPLPGLTVFVEAFPQIGLLNDVPAQDISADVPAASGYGGWSVVYVLDGAVYSAPSTPRLMASTATQTLLVQDALDVALPPGAFRLWAVSLYNGETDILTSNTRLLDLRDWLTPVFDTERIIDTIADALLDGARLTRLSGMGIGRSRRLNPIVQALLRFPYR